MKSGKPICYTSADSVFQIAAHEESFGLERLLEICQIAAKIFHPMMVGRVIARPFVGNVGDFKRTKNRRDYAIALPSPCLNDWVHDAGHRVYGIGKIGDIFSMQGIDEVRKGTDAELMEHLIDYFGLDEPSGCLSEGESNYRNGTQDVVKYILGLLTDKE